MALAHGTGIGWVLAGLPLLPALLLLLLSLAPLLPWFRPGGPNGTGAPRLRGSRSGTPRGVLALAAAAGLLAGASHQQGLETDCRLHLPERGEWALVGRFEARVEAGRAAPFRVESGLPDGCRATLRSWWPSDEVVPPTGVRLHLEGRWEGRNWRDPSRPEWSGRYRVASWSTESARAGASAPRRLDLAGRWLRVRGAVQDRIHLLWGDRAPTVEALVLARREHLDPGLRSAFSRSGTAHLLAISGFHVGVVAGILLLSFRMAGASPRGAALGAAAGSWLYVLGIGAPDAALRAAVLLSLLAAARFRGVPAMSVGALSSAFLLLLVVDPGSLASVGFQLSFAGTFGLVALRRPIEGQVEALWRRWGLDPPRQGPGADRGDRILRGGSDGLVAGTAATLPTLPLLAWHFDQVSLVGIPATLVASPGVALAIPGIGASLLLSVVLLPLGAFLAGGVGLVLALVEGVVGWWAHLPGAVAWVSRPALVASLGAGVVTSLLLARTRAGRVRAPVRRVLGVGAGTVAVLLLPLLPQGRALELHVIDVGQGDALAVRLPGGSWIAVDAGPASASWDAGERRVVPYLRRHGVRRLEALVLTHAHLDHLGGAAAVLREIPVRGVLEPGRVTASEAYLAALREGAAQDAWWWPAPGGRTLSREGVTIHVLHPELPVRPPGGRASDEGPGTDPNQVSVVLLLQYGQGSILLTGDAYAHVEEGVLGEIPTPLTVLKAGHHGSRTSTSEALVHHASPKVAVLNVGDGNRYGHPHPEVLERLEAVGTTLFRTDRDGSFRIRVHRDGSWRFLEGW